MSHFVLTIHTRTAGFGETRAQENNAIMQILHAAAHRIGTGHPPIELKDNSGNHVAHYTFGPHMLNGDAHERNARPVPAAAEPARVTVQENF